MCSTACYSRGVKLALAALLLLTAPALAGDIVGRAVVVDGDTIDIHGARIRLDGIDAPESRQQCQDEAGEDYPCGRISALALDDFLAASRPTRCVQVDTDRYGRIVATCWRADGAEVNAWLVRNGFAIDFKRYSRGKYLPEQAEAQKAKRGVWRGLFVNPDEFRRTKRHPPS